MAENQILGRISKFRSILYFVNLSAKQIEILSKFLIEKRNFNETFEQNVRPYTDMNHNHLERNNFQPANRSLFPKIELFYKKICKLFFLRQKCLRKLFPFWIRNNFRD